MRCALLVLIKTIHFMFIHTCTIDNNEYLLRNELLSEAKRGGWVLWI